MDMNCLQFNLCVCYRAQTPPCQMFGTKHNTSSQTTTTTTRTTNTTQITVTVTVPVTVTVKVTSTVTTATTTATTATATTATTRTATTTTTTTAASPTADNKRGPRLLGLLRGAEHLDAEERLQQCGGGLFAVLAALVVCMRYFDNTL